MMQQEELHADHFVISIDLNVFILPHHEPATTYSENGNSSGWPCQQQDSLKRQAAGLEEEEVGARDMGVR